MTKEFLLLTAAPERDILSHALLDKLRQYLPPPNVLGEGEAVEYALNASHAASAKNNIEAIKASLKNAPIDINIVPAEKRQKSLLVADLESTIIEQECLDELAHQCGMGEKVAKITRRAMRGELDFETALQERVRVLAGLPETALLDLYENGISLMSGAQILLATMRARQAHCGLVSGGFEYFASRIAKRLGFHRYWCNDWHIANGQLTGTIAEPILGRAAKAEIMTRWCAELHLTPADALAVGDGSNDLAMLESAGLGVAYRAKPIVAQAAQFHIEHGDLTALLYLQGIAKSEFVTP